MTTAAPDATEILQIARTDPKQAVALAVSRPSREAAPLMVQLAAAVPQADAPSVLAAARTIDEVSARAAAIGGISAYLPAELREHALVESGALWEERADGGG